VKLGCLAVRKADESCSRLVAVCRGVSARDFREGVAVGIK